MIPPLPQPVRRVRSPDLFSISSLGRATACALSAALDADGHASRLPTHPRARYGAALHELVELAAKGYVDDADGFAAGARRLLSCLAETLPDGTPSPALVYGGLEWRRMVADAVAVAYRVARPFSGATWRPVAHSARRPVQRRATSAPWHVEDGRWLEVDLVSDDLRLAGRADLVTRRGDGVTVTDLKTGTGAVRGGQAASHVAIQLRAYGLVVAERLPRARVDLLVTARSDVPVPFGPGEQLETERAVRTLSELLPRGVGVDATAVATPGPTCRYCAHRPRCGAYLAEAPSWWRLGADYPVPLDVWGRVRSVASDRTGRTTVVLDDAAGRRVQLSSLSPKAPIERDEMLHAFGLEEPAGYWRRGRRTAPLAYHDYDAETGTSAWTLALYGSREEGTVPDSARSSEHVPPATSS